MLHNVGQVVVEKKIKGREIQIAVLGDTYLPAVEIIPANFNSAKAMWKMIQRLEEVD